MKQHLKFMLILLSLSAFCQQKSAITLEDIWFKGTFSPKSVYGVNWMNTKGQYSSLVYTRDGASAVVRYEIVGGKALDTLVHSRQIATQLKGKTLSFSDYQFSADEQLMLLVTESEQIYRRSTVASHLIYHVKEKWVKPLSTSGKQSNPTFSPDGKRIAFTRDNNIWLVDLADMQEKLISKGGKVNEIINGSSDWVYEEEFSISKAYEWSPDSRFIAYLTFNEREVPEYNMQRWDGLYPKDYKYKYPKAGEKNAIVTASVVDVTTGTTTPILINDNQEHYLPRISWTANGKAVSVIKMNRLQNKIEILHADPSTGQCKVAYSESHPQYLDLFDDLIYLNDGKSFLYSSERSGFKHVYRYDMSGKQLEQLTIGDWEVDEVLGFDEATGRLFFTSTESGSRERQFYVIQNKNKKKLRLTTESGSHGINLSPDFNYFLDYHSTIQNPTTVSLKEAQSGKQIRVLESNENLKSKLSGYQLNELKFISIPGADKSELSAYMILPAAFDPQRKYPVLMHVYGGPGSQQVRDSWMGSNYFWHQMLANEGYLIVVADNRGTGGKGEKFKKQTYAQLGKLETEDQIAVAKYLIGLPYVDAERIGIWGWSYGGYMSSLSLMIGNDYFKAGIAVAPVSNWRLYDSIYTERYLGLPGENKKGYDDNSPLSHTDSLKGRYLLVHGTGDDNVHFQNAVELSRALIKSGKQFDSFYYPDKNHGIYGGNTRLHLYTMMTNWLKENL